MKDRYLLLIDLCDNLSVDNYQEWFSLVDELFTEKEFKLIRKNAQLGLINEVKFIKSMTKHKLRLLDGVKVSSNLKVGGTSLQGVCEQMDGFKFKGD